MMAAGLEENHGVHGYAFFMFQLAFCGAAATIVSGAMSERTGFVPYLACSLIIGLVIYPLFGHWVWGNLLIEDNRTLLGSIGFHDFAGSTVVDRTHRCLVGRPTNRARRRRWEGPTDARLQHPVRGAGNLHPVVRLVGIQRR
jgi:hypothetical protein